VWNLTVEEYHEYTAEGVLVANCSWPDIDTDICKRGRGRVIAHLKERYGAESVGRITSYKALQGKTALKDAGRALGISYFRLNALCSGVPNLVAGKAPTVGWMVGKTHSPECAEARKHALAAAASAGLPLPPEPPCQCPHNVPALRDAVDTDPIDAELRLHAADDLRDLRLRGGRPASQIGDVL
jgi:hypothetical protein